MSTTDRETLADNDVLGEASTELEITQSAVQLSPSLIYPPAYQEHTVSPPPYSSIQSTRPNCTCHKTASREDNSNKTRKNTFIWAVLHVLFLGVVISVISTILGVTARLALDEGDTENGQKYERLALLMSLIGSFLAIPGFILFYVLFFTDRLTLNHSQQHPS